MVSYNGKLLYATACVMCLLMAQAAPIADVLSPYAGELSAGKVFSDLDLDKIDAHAELHDFSVSSALEHDDNDHLITLGGHLESHGNSFSEVNAAKYAESEAVASEHYDNHLALGAAHEYEGHQLGGLDLHGYDEFESKPVPGIDHGKGAFSYSTLYEFKDKQDDAY